MSWGADGQKKLQSCGIFPRTLSFLDFFLQQRVMHPVGIEASPTAANTRKSSASRFFYQKLLFD